MFVCDPIKLSFLTIFKEMNCTIRKILKGLTHGLLKICKLEFLLQSTSLCKKICLLKWLHNIVWSRGIFSQGMPITWTLYLLFQRYENYLKIFGLLKSCLEIRGVKSLLKNLAQISKLFKWFNLVSEIISLK